ncbi:tetratricopeptide repeat protein [Pseudomarimonas salicorniae]|uniref:Tetratricopeptide repeat protein n=1 Tax=Pseudomarimonas salicorniae TaxID=2933270 RepID=A0ABT0GD26_9GAMM|nr:tetratricopeptide repeat protein [Lysobacter sp. CAU 1642]MCK7592446.1 tetratricopeptide repeat protein [Lysobacter sp. CAU 1642]
MRLANLLKTAVLFLLLAAIAAPADAQRNRKDDKPEPAYPNATREDPDPKQSRRMQSKVKKMYELSQEDNPTATEAAALEVLESKLSTPYEKSLASQIIAVSYIDRDDYDSAVTYFEKALQENGLPNDSHYQIMYQIAQLHMSDERYDQALAYLDRFFTETRSEKAEALAIKGNILYRLERFPEAIDTLSKAIAATEEPQSSWYQLLMAAYADTEQFDKAGEVAEQLLQKDPNDKALIRNLASIYINADLNDKALVLLEGAKAKGLLTEERDYRQLYQLYHFAEKEPQAIATIQEGLDKGILKPSLEVYRTMAEANYFSENIPAAIEAYKKAAAFAQDGEISLNLARVLYEEARWNEAKASAKEALAKGIRRPGDAHIVLGGAELELGNRAAAIAAYREAAKYPETENNARAWLKSAGVK